MSDSGGLESFLGNVTVHTTSGRGFTPEEIAERALDKLIYVGANAHPVIREQAEAFKDEIRHVLIFYMYEVVRSHNVTLANRFKKNGFGKLAKLLDD